MRRRILVAIIVFLVVAGGVVAVRFDGIILQLAARSRGLELEYAAMGRDKASGQVVIDGLSLTERQTGMRLAAKRARIPPGTRLLSGEGTAIPFVLEEVRFEKAGGGPAPAAPDTLTSLVLTPFEGSWRYSTISGDVSFRDGAIMVKEITARGDGVTFSIKDSTCRDGVVDAHITIAFSPEAAAQFPEEVTGTVFSEGPGGWRSFSVDLKGDSKAPAMQVTGKLFRLNIRNKD